MADKALSLVNPNVPALVEAQQRMLNGKTDKKAIKTRQGRGGTQVKYVELGYVQAELNKIFNYAWSWKIISEKQVGDDIVVRGELTVPFSKEVFITKSAYGGVKVKKDKVGQPIDLGDDYKAAAADALKKAASQFGIAADVYAKEDYYKIEREVTSSEEAVDNLKLQTMRKFFVTASQRGFEEEAAKNIIKNKYKVAHMSELSVDQMQETIVSLVSKYKIVGKENKPEQFVEPSTEKAIGSGRLDSTPVEGEVIQKDPYERDWTTLGKTKKKDGETSEVAK